MKAGFTDEQFIAMIKEQEAGEKTADVCRGHALPSRVLQAKAREGDQFCDVLQIQIKVWRDGTF